MSRQIIVLDEAEDELIAAERWYESRRPGLGREFRRAIHEAIERLSANPLVAPALLNTPKSLGARQVIVTRFPYSIIIPSYSLNMKPIFGLSHSRTKAAGPAIGVTD